MSSGVVGSVATATVTTAGARAGEGARAAERGTGERGRTGARLCLAWSCCALALLGGGGVGVVRADDSLNSAVAEAFVFSGAQLTVLTEEVLTEEGVFTDYTETDGLWRTEKDNGDSIDQTVWTSGMVAGMFWYQYDATGDEAMKTAAEFYCSGLEGLESEEDNDTGFQILNSFGLGYRLTGSEGYLQRVLTGAEALHGFRWDGNIPAYWSWENPSRRPDWDRAVNVDMMMNLEILLWAGLNGGEDHELEVEGHADSTWKDIVREDNSTNHVAAYDIDTGELIETGTYQGYTNSSTWTRGQAWAIYGYAMVYRFLPEQRFLDRSIGLLKYYEDNLPEDLIPPADFDAPESATDNGKDSSAAAIVSSGLLELFLETEDPTYLVKSQNYLSALFAGTYYQPDATDGYQSILRRAMREWGDEDGEIGAVFGDYFFLETMVRYQKLAPSIILWQEAGVEVTVSRRRRLQEETRQEETLAEAAEEVEQEGEMRRLQQELDGGQFCALTVSGGTVSFADPACVPVAPDFSVLDTGSSGSTPAPSVAADDDEGTGGIVVLDTPSPTPDARGGLDTPAPTLAPYTTAPLGPGETPAPTVAAQETLQPLVSTDPPMGDVVGVTPAPTTQQPVTVPPTGAPVGVGETPVPTAITEPPVAITAQPVTVTVPPTKAPVGMVVTPAPIPVTEPPVPMTAQPVTVPPTNAPVREVTPAPIAVTEPPVAVKRTKAPETVLPSSAPVSGGTVTGATVDLTSDAPTAGRALAAAVGLSSTPVPAAVNETSGADITYGSTVLDNDVDLSYLDETSTIIVWLSVTLDNTSNTPSVLSLENAEGSTLSTAIPDPDSGWQAGSNRVKFEVVWTTFVPAEWTAVSSVVLGFSASTTAASSDVTTATTNWLVITNDLVL